MASIRMIHINVWLCQNFDYHIFCYNSSVFLIYEFEVCDSTACFSHIVIFFYLCMQLMSSLVCIFIIIKTVYCNILEEVI